MTKRQARNKYTAENEIDKQQQQKMTTNIKNQVQTKQHVTTSTWATNNANNVQWGSEGVSENFRELLEQLSGMDGTFKMMLHNDQTTFGVRSA